MDNYIVTAMSNHIISNNKYTYNHTKVHTYMPFVPCTGEALTPDNVAAGSTYQVFPPGPGAVRVDISRLLLHGGTNPSRPLPIPSCWAHPPV